MNCFALDTSSDRIVLGMEYRGVRSYARGEPCGRTHNARALTDIDEFLRARNAKLEEFDYFCAGVGPGSFTGIRIGVATVNAFALAFGKRAVEVNCLETEDDGSERTVALRCGHGNCYFARFGADVALYGAATEAEARAGAKEITFIDEISAEKLLDKAMEKIRAGLTVEFARPMYIKKSSAEREST